ncbi:hypothetical protein LTS08_000068 [Lithohypha guttulata]|nr:hypothetical protein LTS08_000068 [Lithohypha guttulata]
MSDLYAMNQPGSNSARYQDSKAQADAAAAAQAGITTPRQIMAARNARKAQQEASLRQTQETDPSRRRQQEDVVGVAPDSRRQQTSRINYTDAEPTARLPAGQNVTIGGRADTIPTTNGIASRSGNTTLNQGQLRSGAAQQTYNPTQSQLPSSLQAGQPPADASRIQRNRTEAYEKLEMPAVADARAPQQQRSNQPQTSGPAPSVRAAFPHAFERLQQNTDELESKPIDKQMARQITDLSAAGANLFHAVVELQRLRASSERKFQRWFFETRNEQEAAAEKYADLQKQLQAERQNRPQISNATMDSLRAEKVKADELVREMRRELQISKEEARRAWEELGRREQEERERTIALRSGEPTLIGGVQVLPMQGLTSRHNTSASQRPVTRDGPYQGGPSATLMGGQQPLSRSQESLDSPTQEQHQFRYQADATSPTDTDPFIETAPRSVPPSLRHEPDTHFMTTGSPQGRQTTAQAMAAARAVTSPAQSQRSTHNRSEGPSYIPSTRSGAGSIQSDEEYHIGPDGQYLRDPQGRPIPYRQPLGGYEEVASDDEDHAADVEREQMLAQQYAQRQQQSRYTPQGQPAHTPSRSPQHYPQSVYAQTTTTPLMQIQQTPFHNDSPAQSRHTTSSTLSPATPQQPPPTARLASPSHNNPADYEGAAYGDDDEEEEGMYPPPPPDPVAQTSSTQARTHHVPTRLSDIPEERTDASRSSRAFSATPTTTSDTLQGGILGTRR